MPLSGQAGRSCMDGASDDSGGSVDGPSLASRGTPASRCDLLQQRDFVEVPCPSHDNPMLMIPKEHRRTFFDDLFDNDEFKWNLFTEQGIRLGLPGQALHHLQLPLPGPAARLGSPRRSSG